MLKISNLPRRVVSKVGLCCRVFGNGEVTVQPTSDRDKLKKKALKGTTCHYLSVGCGQRSDYQLGRVAAKQS
jgi:hypothetical protein